MNVLFDNNLSPSLARALQALLLQHSVVALRERFAADTSDVDWIAALGRSGRWAVISGDRRILRSRFERRIFLHSRLIGFFMSAGLFKAPVIKQAERLLALWPSIEATVASLEGGALFELPMTSLRLRQIQP